MDPQDQVFFDNVNAFAARLRVRANGLGGNAVAAGFLFAVSILAEEAATTFRDVATQTEALHAQNAAE